jgi:folate-dependent phosphoribosylglycinamide formyltransferase PurN
MNIGSGCTVHLRADELPGGTIVCQCSRHLVAVVDGVLQDTHDSSRSGTRCVYGYWSR